jgi:hypothetical protein
MCHEYWLEEMLAKEAEEEAKKSAQAAIDKAKQAPQGTPRPAVDMPALEQEALIH